MRRPLAAISLLTVAVLLSACAASQSPGWTFAPPTPAPTAGPSGAADASTAPSAAASAGASAAASGEAPSAGASAAASGGTGSGVVDITAFNIAWTTKDVSAPANTGFKIHFDNQDASTPHNIIIKDGTGMEMFKTDLLTGVATMDYDVPALPAGTYTFVCVVHPAMVGNLTVGP